MQDEYARPRLGSEWSVKPTGEVVRLDFTAFDDFTHDFFTHLASVLAGR
jgi:hypothetical protein